MKSTEANNNKFSWSLFCLTFRRFTRSLFCYVISNAARLLLLFFLFLVMPPAHPNLPGFVTRVTDHAHKELQSCFSFWMIWVRSILCTSSLSTRTLICSTTPLRRVSGVPIWRYEYRTWMIIILTLYTSKWLFRSFSTSIWSEKTYLTESLHER